MVILDIKNLIRDIKNSISWYQEICFNDKTACHKIEPARHNSWLELG